MVTAAKAVDHQLFDVKKHRSFPEASHLAGIQDDHHHMIISFCLSQALIGASSIISWKKTR